MAQTITRAMAHDELVTVKEATVILKMGNHKIYDLLHRGYLPYMKLPGGYRIRRTSIDEFLQKYDGYDMSDLGNISKIDPAKDIPDAAEA